MATSMLVDIVVMVTGNDGRAVEGLRPEDFTVKEDDVVQHINIFEFQHPPSQDSKASYYVLGYYTANSDPTATYRRVNVAVNRPAEVWIKYRPGYNAGPRFAPNPAASAILRESQTLSPTA